MSQLDQAKREAARLLKLAKKNESNDTPPFTLTINNLSHAKEHIANINGYPNWNIFEKELKKRDGIQDNNPSVDRKKEIENLLDNIDLFERDLPFLFHPKPIRTENYKIVKDKQHIPITLGNFLPKEFYSIREKFLNKSKQWALTSYPAICSGSTGSGKTASFVGLSHQYVENGEGLMYIDGKGDTSIYTQLFSIAKQHNRLDDFYFLNLFNSNTHHEISTKISHTIDPINPLIGDEQSFKILFGDKIGVLLHEFSKCVKSQNGLVSIENIESFLILKNIQNFRDDPLFSCARPYIDDYLNTLDDVSDNQLKAHVLNCDIAFQTMESLNVYKDIFSIHPEINLEKAFYQKKILFVLFPAVEKMGWAFSEPLINLIMLNINKVIKDFEHRENTQTIIIDDIPTVISNRLAEHLVKTPLNSINVIYGVQDFYRDTYFMRHIIKQSKTFIIMKGEFLELPDIIKLRIMNDLKKFPEFYKYRYIINQTSGEAMVFGYNDFVLDKKNYLNHERGYSFSSLKLLYRPTEPVKYVYLNKKEM